MDAPTHAKLTPGRSDNKFGIPLRQAAAAYEAAAKLKNIQIKGVQMHIGSQLTQVHVPDVAQKRRSLLVPGVLLGATLAGGSFSLYRYGFDAVTYRRRDFATIHRSPSANIYH